MTHNRKYVPSGVALVMGRVKNSGKMIDQDKIEKILIDSNFFEDMPFKWVGLLYLYGIKNSLIPKYERINKKYGDLPIEIELKMEILEWADQHNLELLYDIFMIGALEALMHVGKKYKLPTHLLEAERLKYGNVPETIEECQNYHRPK